MSIDASSIVSASSFFSLRFSSSNPFSLRASETFTLGAPHVDGIGAISGTGVCTKGSKAHRGETCRYTFSGTYDLRTQITQITLRGTYTLATKHKKKTTH